MESVGQQHSWDSKIVFEDESFWHGKRVFVTGHTGFKGSWLSLWLSSLGAKVTGYALPPTNKNDLFHVAEVESELEHSIFGDIRDHELLTESILKTGPEIVFHLAAQPLVRESYRNPVDTYMINVMGTVNVFEACRKSDTVKAIVNVTTDKCYENKEWIWGYREGEPLGGYDPYSSSKACAELVTSAYRNSYFNNKSGTGVALASVRAGNVIGGGDWSEDRLVPDILRALIQGNDIIIRSPRAVRPWQHVLEPLSGYLRLAKHLYQGDKVAEAWNFGPDDTDVKTVEWIVQSFCRKWGGKSKIIVQPDTTLHEAHQLKLDCSKAKAYLNWYPRWNLDQAIDKIVEWTLASQANNQMKAICLRQIQEFTNSSQ
ncbi:CDP-glucose 4,6-dehydratase [Paenibacillus silvae]|uniref:CDP-glucose 4,6-dehydratase n=1 Tax=Paenibacillus silvae TaxID=1325358 RepID=A0ABQ1ZH38_9BACL|nr:CDP-glucose 4,6-dehydratase [Paenibacillus silvae]GGH64331.1 CDP-glucose 4,6-dehydratase [Paenibacillus silvae]